MLKLKRFSFQFLFMAMLAQSQLSAYAQGSWQFNAQVNLGSHLNLTYGKKQNFAGLKIFSAFSIAGVHDRVVFVNYGLSLSVYTKTIGANLNPLVGDIQIDLGNSFSAGAWWGGNVGYMKNFRTIHTGDYYNISTDR